MSDLKAVLTQNVITICQGSDYEETVVLSVPDPDFPNDESKDTAYDLTGCTVASTLRNMHDQLVGTFTCETQPPATDGTFIRKMSNTITKDLVPANGPNHVWGIQVTKADGTILKEIQGGADITKELV